MTAIFWICSIFGIAIDVSPWIKFNPIRWCFSQIGKLLNGARFDEIKTEMHQLKEEVRQNRYEQDQSRIKDIRSRILDFSNSLNKRERDLEEFEEIFDLDEEYINLLNKYNEQNGRTSRAMGNIKHFYNSKNRVI